MKNLIFTLLLFNGLVSFSQIKGKCLDENKEPIPYVNVTIKGKKIGTVTNLKGEFVLTSNKAIQTDTLIFSDIRYVSKSIKVEDFKGNIELKENTEKLEEVIISTSKKRKVKEKIVGTKTTSGLVTLWYTSRNLGTELGKVIKVKNNREYYLKNVSFNIVDLGYKSATFRVNFYKIRRGFINPRKEQVSDNIVKVDKKGLVTLDISDQQILFDENFLVSIEWIDVEIDEDIEKEKRNISFSSTVFSGPFAYRDNPNLKWIKEKVKFNCGLGIFLKVDSYKK